MTTTRRSPRGSLGAREVARDGRLVVAFQPHRYSRTAAFHDDFGAALGLADEVVVMEVYAAGEDPIPGVTGASVAAAVPLPMERVVFETVLVGRGRDASRSALVRATS
jgi:UDP-N-acetylmuramate--alanine ligase